MRNVACADGAMVGRALFRPLIHKFLSTDRKVVAAVGVSNVVEIHEVEFGKRTACTKFVHYFHGLGIFHFALASHGDISVGEQGISGDDRIDDIFIFVARFAFIIISH